MKPTAARRTLAAATACSVGGAPALADARPNSLFGTGAVLQRGIRLPVWGTARDGERVTVKLCGQTATATAVSGKWKVWLKPMRAGGPFALEVAGDRTVVSHDVLIGDVWVCSGQSNMELPLWMARDGEAAARASSDPQLRLYSVAHNIQPESVADARSAWAACGPASVREFSGVGYHFGQELRKALGVPIGLINTSYGGTVLQAWASREALAGNPTARRLMVEFAAMKEPPIWATGQNTWGGLYNGMVAPLIPFGMRGVLWYQGEGNVGGGWDYRDLLPRLIAQWRDEWGQGRFPFLVVQIAPFGKPAAEPGESLSAEIRDAQLLASQSDRKTGLVVTTDVGDEVDIHPRDKRTVGARLALAARALAYGQRIEYCGPMLRSTAFRRGEAVLTFDHAAKGLRSVGGPLRGFAVAGADRKFVRAEAVIRGRQVVVRSPLVAAPAAVRYGWADLPVVNLANAQGLPASPFRTDTWPILSQPRWGGATQGPVLQPPVRSGRGPTPGPPLQGQLPARG